MKRLTKADYRQLLADCADDNTIIEEVPEVEYDFEDQFDVTAEDLRILCELKESGQMDAYSDYFKDCYGIRPRW